MVHSTKTISPLASKIDNFFSLFKGQILALTTTQWSQEDLKGKSYAQWDAMKYYHLMYLLILVYQDASRIQSLGKPWSYFEDKYNLATYRECLACNNISLDKAIEVFGINSLFPTEGIEDMEIEQSFVVENLVPDQLSTSNKEVFISLLTNPSLCINYIK